MFDEGSDSDYFGCYFWHFFEYTEEVAENLKMDKYLLLPHSLKFINFIAMSLCFYVYMCNILTLICHSVHTEDPVKIGVKYLWSNNIRM